MAKRITSFFKNKKINKIKNKLLKKNKDFKFMDIFFKKEINHNKRLIFNYFNFIKLNNNFINKYVVLNDYFEKKELFNIKKIDNNFSLNINNIKTINTVTKNFNALLKVSIIMTIYNEEKLLESSINSLLCQTYKNIELIIVSDGSNDNTLKILNKFKGKIKIVNLKKNYGTYISKNIGITFSSGELITFHDSDDWAHSQRIEEHVKSHLENKKIKYSISKLVRLTEEGYFYSKHVYPLDRLSMVSLMIDRSLLNEIGYFRKHRLGSDTEYFERLKKFTNHEFKRIDKVLMFCAHRENSLTTNSETGVEGFAKNNKRKHYWNKWNAWHKKLLKVKRKPFVKFNREKYEYEIIN